MTFFKINCFFKTTFQEHYQSVNRFGSRSGPTVGPDLGPNCLQRLHLHQQTTKVVADKELIKIKALSEFSEYCKKIWNYFFLLWAAYVFQSKLIKLTMPNTITQPSQIGFLSNLIISEHKIQSTITKSLSPSDYHFQKWFAKRTINS